LGGDFIPGGPFYVYTGTIGFYCSARFTSRNCLGKRPPVAGGGKEGTSQVEPDAGRLLDQHE